jgi:hypothetical protein
LRRGEHVPVANSDGQKVYSFLRRSGDDEVLVVINFSKQRKRADLNLPALKSSRLKEYFTGSVVPLTGNRMSLDLGGLEYRVFVPSAE